MAFGSTGLDFPFGVALTGECLDEGLDVDGFAELDGCDGLTAGLSGFFDGRSLAPVSCGVEEVDSIRSTFRASS